MPNPLADNNATSALLTESEAAYFLRASARTLQDWRVRGCGPKFVKVGSRVVYQRKDLLEWIATRTLQSTTAAAAVIGAIKPPRDYKDVGHTNSSIALLSAKALLKALQTTSQTDANALAEIFYLLDECRNVAGLLGDRTKSGGAA